MATDLCALVVEDDDRQREGLASLVAACGFRVLACRTYDEASSCLGTEHPDVLITDLRLPHHSGLALADLAAKTYPDVRRIVLTAFDDIDFRKEAARTGTQFLLKPIKPAELEAVLAAASHKRGA
jgi:YesN/AraC family two-component response regulator